MYGKDAMGTEDKGDIVAQAVQQIQTVLPKKPGKQELLMNNPLPTLAMIQGTHHYGNILSGGDERGRFTVRKHNELMFFAICEQLRQQVPYIDAGPDATVGPR
jgi:hypothetical protein